MSCRVEGARVYRFSEVRSRRKNFIPESTESTATTRTVVTIWRIFFLCCNTVRVPMVNRAITIRK